MPGVDSSKSESTKDYFCVFLNNRPRGEPNFIWPVDAKPKKTNVNEESTKECYMNVFKSIYADEILIKPRIYKTDDHPRENTFDTIFGNTVKGYSIDNTQTEKDSEEVFSRTTTLKNNLDIRSKDKLRRQQFDQSKAPTPLGQDLIDLIMSKAQASDSTFMDDVESEKNSVLNGSGSDSIGSPRTQSAKDMWIDRSRS